MSSSSSTAGQLRSRRGTKRRRLNTRRTTRFVRGGIAANSLMAPQVPDTPFPLSGSRINQVYTIAQSYELVPWATSSTTVPTFVSNVFTLASLDQVTSLANVFDQYCISDIRLQLVPRINTIDGTVSNSGLFTSVIDLDDNSALSTIGQSQDYQTALTTRGNEVHLRTFKPRVAAALYAGTFTGYGNDGNQWIDTASNTVQHFGVKTAWTSTSSVLYYDAIVTLLVKFRNVR